MLYGFDSRRKSSSRSQRIADIREMPFLAEVLATSDAAGLLRQQSDLWGSVMTKGYP